MLQAPVNSHPVQGSSTSGEKRPRSRFFPSETDWASHRDLIIQFFKECKLEEVVDKLGDRGFNVTYPHESNSALNDVPALNPSQEKATGGEDPSQMAFQEKTLDVREKGDER